MAWPHRPAWTELAMAKSSKYIIFKLGGSYIIFKLGGSYIIFKLGGSSH
jgi:hypothetical protein